MTPPDFEQIAEQIYEAAGFAPNTPRSTLRLAAELLGWHALREVRGLTAVAQLDGHRLLLRAEASPRALEWFTGVELARWSLQRVGTTTTAGAVDLLAACLRAPRPAVESVARDAGPAFSDLAAAFSISESSAALRFGEVTGARLTLYAPNRQPRVRGRGASRAKPLKISLSDAPGRVVKLYAA